MEASALTLEDLVDWIRDSIAAASIAEEFADERLRSDAIEQLRALFAKYLGRSGTSANWLAVTRH